jgi:hypothetical protein
LVLSLLPVYAQADKGAVAVLDIQGTGIEDELLPTLTEILTVEIHALGKHKVIAGRDIQAMLGFEKQKDVLGCTDAACLAEIGGALGVERIVAGHIGKVGSTYVVNIKLINIRMADTEGRVYETVRGEVDALIDTIRKSVTKLFGGEAPKPASAKVAAKPAPQPEPAPASKPKAEASTPPAQTPEPKQVAAAKAPPPQTMVRQEDRGGIGVWPIVLWVGGGAMVLGGVVLGLQAKKLEEEANDPEHIGGQLSAERAESTANLANVAFGLGALAVGGGVLIAVLSGGDDSATAMVPVVGPESIGMAFVGHF